MEIKGAENAFAVELFRALPDRYDVLAEVLSFGQNRRWRAELVGHVANEDPQRVLDVATGTAGVAIAIAKETAAHVTGVDVSEEMLDRGRKRVYAAGLADRILLQAGRAEELPYATGSFDAVAFTYVLRYVQDPAVTLGEMARTLRPGGVMAGLDFFVPTDPWWLGAWWLYTRLALPVAGFALGGRAWWGVGHFLGPNISEHYRRWPLPRLVAAWEAAGMADVRWRQMSLGGGLVMWGKKRDA